VYDLNIKLIDIRYVNPLTKQLIIKGSDAMLAQYILQ